MTALMWWTTPLSASKCHRVREIVPSLRRMRFWSISRPRPGHTCRLPRPHSSSARHHRRPAARLSWAMTGYSALSVWCGEQPDVRLGPNAPPSRSAPGATLPIPQLAGDKHDLALAGLGLRPAPHEQRHLLVAADGRIIAVRSVSNRLSIEFGRRAANGRTGRSVPLGSFPLTSSRSNKLPMSLRVPSAVTTTFGAAIAAARQGSVSPTTACS